MFSFSTVVILIRIRSEGAIVTDPGAIPVFGGNVWVQTQLPIYLVLDILMVFGVLS